MERKITSDELKYLLYCDSTAAQAHKEYQQAESLRVKAHELLQAKTFALEEFYNYLAIKYNLTPDLTITKTGEIVLNDGV